MKKQQGFTLVELVIVVILIGILAAMAVPRFFNLSDVSRAKVVSGTAATFKQGVDAARAQWLASGEAPLGIKYNSNNTVNDMKFHASNKWPDGAIANGGTTAVTTNANETTGKVDTFGDFGGDGATVGQVCLNLLTNIMSGNISAGAGTTASGTASATTAGTATADAGCGAASPGKDWCAYEIVAGTPGTQLAAGNTTGNGCVYVFAKDSGTARYFTYNSTNGEVACTGCSNT